MRTLVLVLGKAKRPDAEAGVVYWDAYSVPQADVSIPQLVEQNADALKTEYLSWIGDLSKSTVHDESLVDFLRIPALDGGSYWWQSLIADRSAYKSRQIYTVFRLRALENLFKEGQYERLSWVGENPLVEKIVRAWLKTEKAVFVKDSNHIPADPGKTSIRRLLKRWYVPKALVFFLNFCWSRLRLLNSTQPNREASCTIVTYFPGIDMKLAADNKFYSNYWGPLQNLVGKDGVGVNWVWIYTDLNQLSFRESVALQTNLNGSGDGNSRYLFIENFLGVTDVINALSTYCKLLYRSTRLRSLQKKFHLLSSNVVFFDALKDDWFDSFRGTTAITNCLYIAAFRRMGKMIPGSTRLLAYVWENQPWEQSLLQTRSYLPDTKFVGMVHTPACYAMMNLKAFPAGVDEISGEAGGRSIPDVLAVPGKYAERIFIKAGWPQSRVKTVEALRYIGSLANQENKYVDDRQVIKKLLVVTGSLEEETRFQMDLLAGALALIRPGNFSEILIKAHPSVPVDKMVSGITGNIPCKVVDSPLAELWSSAALVFTANSTSVALEAFYIGLPLVIAGNAGNLNLNALMGMEAVNFVYTPDELAGYLTNIRHAQQAGKDFFELDTSLSRWRSLFASAGVPV